MSTRIIWKTDFEFPILRIAGGRGRPVLRGFGNSKSYWPVGFFAGRILSMTSVAAALLYKKVAIPEEFISVVDGRRVGGDIRVGDLTGDGRVDFLVYKALGGSSRVLSGRLI